MSTPRSLILLIDDEMDAGVLQKAALERAGYDVRLQTSPLEALKQLEGVAVVVTDLHMEELSGLAVCERLRTEAPEVPVIVLTGFGNVDAAIGALRAGAYDFLVKPVDVKLLLISVARALEQRSLKHEIAKLRSTTSTPTATGIIGQSPPMKKVHDLITRMAPTSASVMIHGETGTGKELVARALHAASTRKAGPFIAINCAAVPPTLLESELFGHAKGAFTDAKTSRTGLFVQASGGTLFLDEIGEMPAEMQAKLLRALQERKVRPVGGDVEVAFDARILSATHKDLEDCVAQGTFRQDLFYRINVVSIEVPPLRERGHDILELAENALRDTARRNSREPPRLSPAVAGVLLSYTWPGNVRELENCIERAVSLSRYQELTVDDLPERVRQYKAESFSLQADDPTEILTLAEVQRRYTDRVLKLLNGNKSRAAQLLGVDRRTLYRRMESEVPGAAGEPQAADATAPENASESEPEPGDKPASGPPGPGSAGAG